jgi:hypothetical protein
MFESASGRIAKWALAESVQQAVALGAGQTLPVSARSLPTNEVRGKGCALAGIIALLAFVGLPLIAVMLVAAGNEPEPRRTVIYVAILAFAGFALIALARGWRARRADYVDPQLTVEAGADGVTIGGPSGRHVLRYPQVQARISSIGVRQSIRFVGIVMDSPVGELRLDDYLFANGRNVAGAIVRGISEARASS